MATNYKRKVEKYVEDVLSGRRPAGRYERLAVERHLNDLRKGRKFPYEFHPELGLFVCNFFEELEHYKGEKAGTKIILEGWQAFIIYCVYGWIDKKTKLRRFNYADVVVARKNGKTTMAAGLGLFALVADGESGAEVYSAAVDKEQAKICWGAAKELAKKSPMLSFLLLYKSAIIDEEGAAFFKPLSKDTKNKDGTSPSFAICDERHEWQNNALFNVIKSGMGARSQPLIFSITTAGFNTALPYFQQQKYLKDILDGLVVQDNQFAIIYEPDKDDDISSEETWKKANPNYGVSVNKKYLMTEYLEARNKGGENMVNFLTKNLNMWCDAPEVWIDASYVAACDFGTEDSSLLGQRCYAGFDFASHVDIVALVLYFPYLEHQPVKCFFWLPEEKVWQNKDDVDYRRWAEQGYIHLTPGNIIDIDAVVDGVLTVMSDYDVVKLAYDPYKTYHGIIQGLIKAGREEVLMEFSQGIGNVSEPTKEVQRLIEGAEVDLMRNPVLSWMFGNVILYKDNNENIRVSKGKSKNKIDGVAAFIDAVGGYMSLNDKSNRGSIYTRHTLRTIKI